MEIEAWIKQNKELNTAILRFLESENESKDEFRALTKIIDDQEIVKNEQSTREMFKLLYKIGDNHHRTTDFFKRFVQIIEYLTKESLPINDTEIIDIYKRNKRLLLLIFEHKLINVNESIVKYLTEQEKFKQLQYYLFSEIKNYFSEEIKTTIENQITKEFKEDIEIFEAKCKEGENGLPICKMIREDSVEEFVSYVNRTNLPLTSTIKSDIYESNSFLIGKEPSLIEYAFFYGSIQIIKYLRNNHVEIPTDIYQYAIHSNNPEMIEYLEDNDIQFDKESLKESIKCHHNDITNYIMDKLTNQTQDEKFYDDISITASEFCNYYYYPEDITSIILNPEKNKFKMQYLTKSFTKITIPSSITSIGNYAFRKCSSLTQITIPSSVTSIGGYAFSECSSLTEITIPSSVTQIKYYAFSECSSLTQVSIPSSVTSIGNYAFDGCSSLTQISIPSSILKIKCYVFAGCSSLTQISIPYTVTSIGDGAFDRCSSLTQISIPYDATSIGDDAFSECSLLTKISFEASHILTSIGDNAFYKCSSLTQITIPSSVTSIGNNAFKGCSSLTQISIPSIINTRNLGIDSKVKIDII